MPILIFVAIFIFATLFINTNPTGLRLPLQRHPQQLESTKPGLVHAAEEDKLLQEHGTQISSKNPSYTTKKNHPAIKPRPSTSTVARLKWTHTRRKTGHEHTTKAPQQIWISCKSNNINIRIMPSGYTPPSLLRPSSNEASLKHPTKQDLGLRTCISSKNSNLQRTNGEQKIKNAEPKTSTHQLQAWNRLQPSPTQLHMKEDTYNQQQQQHVNQKNRQPTHLHRRGSNLKPRPSTSTDARIKKTHTRSSCTQGYTAKMPQQTGTCYESNNTNIKSRPTRRIHMIANKNTGRADRGKQKQGELCSVKLSTNPRQHGRQDGNAGPSMGPKGQDSATRDALQSTCPHVPSTHEVSILTLSQDHTIDTYITQFRKVKPTANYRTWLPLEQLPCNRNTNPSDSNRPTLLRRTEKSPDSAPLETPEEKYKTTYRGGPFLILPQSKSVSDREIDSRGSKRRLRTCRGRGPRRGGIKRGELEHLRRASAQGRLHHIQRPRTCHLRSPLTKAAATAIGGQEGSLEANKQHERRRRSAGNETKRRGRCAESETGKPTKNEACIVNSFSADIDTICRLNSVEHWCTKFVMLTQLDDDALSLVLEQCMRTLPPVYAPVCLEVVTLSFRLEQNSVIISPLHACLDVVTRGPKLGQKPALPPAPVY